MRLARDYERAEGPDLRGFVTFAHTQDLVEAREGEAALESEGLDAVPADDDPPCQGAGVPGRVRGRPRPRGGRRPRPAAARAGTGASGCKLAPIGGGEPVSALDWQRLADAEQAADAEEERRLFYVAMTRARERLILSGGIDCERLPDPRPGGPPIDWIARALVGRPVRRGRRGAGDARPAQLGRPPGAAALSAERARDARRRAPARRARPGRAPARRRPGHRTAGRAGGPARPARARAAGAAAPLLQLARRVCPLRLPVLPRAPARAAARRAAAARGRGRRRRRADSTPGCAARSSTSRSSGSTSRAPEAPEAEAVLAMGGEWDVQLDARRRRGHPRARGGVRRVIAVRAAGRRAPRPAARRRSRSRSTRPAVGRS